MTYLTDPRVPAILERIRNNPPECRKHLIPSISSLYGRDEIYLYHGDDVAALRAINNELFLRAEDARGYEGAKDYCNNAPEVQDVVARVLAGEHFEGMAHA